MSEPIEPSQTSQPANEDVARLSLTFDSSDGESAVHMVVWVPLSLQREAERVGQLQSFKPRGVVQLIHGMAEHIERYDAFARFLATRGYFVVGHDHIGHGKTADPQNWGVIDAATGATSMINDVQQVRALATEQVVPGTPYFMFGHSMGSLVLRSYLPLFGTGLAGAVICGTAHEPVIVSQAGNALACALARLRGADYRSPLLHRLADGAYSHAIKDARTPFDWLSRDHTVVDAFIADESTGFMFGAGAYAALTELSATAASSATAKHTPKDVPLLFVAGSADPVGKNGEGVKAAAKLLEDAGVQEVTLRLFPGMRHEILNEYGRREVYEFIAAWLEAHM